MTKALMSSMIQSNAFADYAGNDPRKEGNYQKNQ